jgi:hypothetical protein
MAVVWTGALAINGARDQSGMFGQNARSGKRAAPVGCDSN